MNFLNLSVSEIIAKVLQLIVFVYLARFFGKSEFGNFGFALAFSTIIVIIADFGLSTLLIREISRNKDEVAKYISNTFTIKIFLSLLTFFCAFIYLNFMHYTNEVNTVTYAMLSFMVLQSFTDIFYSAFRSFEKMHYDSFIKFLRMIVLLILVYVAIKIKPDLFVATLMFPITELLMLIISSIIYTKNFAKLYIAFDYDFSKNIAKKSSFFLLSLVFSSVLIYIDTIMLQQMRGSDEVGVYAAAYNLLLGLTFVPLMYSNAVYPVFSRNFIKDKSLLKFAYKKSYQYMLILGLPIAISIYTYANTLISFIYGSGYKDSIIALKILCWFVLLRFINIIPGTALSSINKQGSRVLSQGTVASINVILNLILIPKYGFVGAGFATIISESFFIIFYSYFITKYGLNFGILKTFIKPLIASVIMASIIINIRNIFLGVIAGYVSYFIILILMKTFSEEDKSLLIKVLRNT